MGDVASGASTVCFIYADKTYIITKTGSYLSAVPTIEETGKLESWQDLYFLCQFREYNNIKYSSYEKLNVKIPDYPHETYDPHAITESIINNLIEYLKANF